MPNNSNKLNEILAEFARDWIIAAATAGTTFKDGEKVAAQARAQIVEWAVGIVGEDETPQDWLYLDKTTQGLYIARNALRAELRAKLKGEA